MKVYLPTTLNYPHMSDDWISNRVKTADSIKKASPQERLGYVNGCIQCLAAIGQSNQGWLQWLSNPTMMNEFDENDLKYFFEKFKDFALQYIEFDIDATKKGTRPMPQEKGNDKYDPYG
jgi:hypothetical protein